MADGEFRNVIPIEMDSTRLFRTVCPLGSKCCVAPSPCENKSRFNFIRSTLSSYWILPEIFSKTFELRYFGK